MLKISLATSQKELDEFLEKAQKHIMQCLLDALAQLCQECDERARSRGWDESFRDVTGNLRSSIGGAVYDHGVVYYTTNFDTVRGGGLGSSRGRAMANSLASNYAKSVSMVFLAAMDYAEYVEAIESKDVIESTRLWAEGEVVKRLEAAKEKAIKEINAWKR